MHTPTLESAFGLFLSFQVKDLKWRLSDGQARDIQEIKDILHKRGLKKK